MTNDDEPAAAEAVLSKDEEPVYRWLVSYHGEDPDEHLSGRLLTVTPEHYAELGDMWANIGSNEVEKAEKGEDNRAAEIVFNMDAMMTKLANSLKREGLADRAKEIIEERGLDNNPYE